MVSPSRLSGNRISGHRTLFHLFLGATLALTVSSARAQHPAAAQRTATRNRTPLAQNVFNPLPLGSVQPEGWLKEQLQIQAQGLSGHLDEFWKDVGPDSGWLGGTGESWERGPYYLDGVLPLAYELNDAGLKAKAQKWVEWTLTHQRPDGQFGPTSNDDWWPRMVMLKVLTQYEEATGDPRVIPLMEKYFAYELRTLPSRPLRDWGRFRWQDNALSVLWLYNRTGDPQLLKLAALLHRQGWDWEHEFQNFPWKAKTSAADLGLNSGPPGDHAMQTHGVNNAMALKATPVWSLLTGSAGDRREFWHQLDQLDTYHSLPNGMFSADEHLAGHDPSQGTELCTVVETMFSLEQDLAILGDASLGDRLERISYNALPGTISDDMWSHQYDQQPNQVSCTKARRDWSTNGPESNLFGLEPNFGCCTANMHQGWPKLTESLWMQTGAGDGVVAIAYAPSHLSTTLRNGHAVSIEEQTNYPFAGQISLKLALDRPAKFPLLLRIPGWVAPQKPALEVNGKAVEMLASTTARRSGDSHSNAKFVRLDREWRSGDTVMLTLPMRVRYSFWYRNSASVERGPLLFSLKMESEWSPLKKYAERSADWQLTSPEAWNYALMLDPRNAACTTQESTASAPSDVPFGAQAPAVELAVRGRRVPAWQLEENSAGPLPQSPVSVNTPVENLILVPYASTKLRITAFPWMKAPLCEANPNTHTGSE